MSISERFERVSRGATDGRRLALVRVIVGGAAVAKGLFVWELLRRLAHPATLRVPFFDGAPALPAEAVPWVAGAWLVAAGCFAIGFMTPIAGGALTAVMGSVLLLDQQLYSNHLYLLVLVVFLLTIGRAGRCLSIDGLLRRAPIDPTVPAWPALLLRWQLTIVYAFAGLSKINPEYLSGAVLRTELLQAGGLTPPPELLDGWTLVAMAAGSILVELFLAVGFWLPRCRPLAVFVGLGFHLGMIATMGIHVVAELGVFAITLCSLYLLFFDAQPEPAASGEPEHAEPLPGRFAAG